MFYARLISPMLVVTFVYYDPEKDSEYVWQLIDKGYRIEEHGKTPIAIHISDLFKRIL